MVKIPNIFVRDPENMRICLKRHNQICKWVFDGEGRAIRKYDGTCVMIKNGEYFKRRAVRSGRLVPANFIEVEYDPNTDKRVGWVEVSDNPNDKYHLEAFNSDLSDGTYELVGPKIQNNPENFDHHVLIKHSEAEEYSDIPRNFEGLKLWFRGRDIEGIVFHHPDGRMGKIKKTDFGLNRKPQGSIE